MCKGLELCVLWNGFDCYLVVSSFLRKKCECLMISTRERQG